MDAALETRRTAHRGKISRACKQKYAAAGPAARPGRSVEDQGVPTHAARSHFRPDRRLPTSGLVHHLVALRIYSDAERVIAMYRRWFEFCDRRIANAREHVIVELDTKLKFYSRHEWETETRDEKDRTSKEDDTP
jgi:hypothetical protein